MKHRTADGTVMDIADMSNSHLLNTIKMLERRAKEGHVVRYGGGTTAEDIWYDEDHLYGREALKALNYDHYIQEAKKRGLPCQH